MKSILVAGTGSYLGESFRRYMKQWPDSYRVVCLDTIGQQWKDFDFSAFDTVYQVAGIAHIKETEDNKELYYKVNRDLAIDIAKKAKEAGVRQFIYLSSMSVYGLDEGIITPETKINPQSHYALSKAQAEEQLRSIENSNFQIAILRPPMVYGKDCRGNYNELEKIALKLPFFPKIKNERSMIYIDNLCEFVKQIIDQNNCGLFFPQNREYVCTYEMAKLIREANGRKTRPGYLTGVIIKICLKRVKKVMKAFGNLTYRDTERMNFAYSKYGLKESINEMYKDLYAE